jgi:hypothetical protein
MLFADMSVDLSRLKTGVPEQFLDNPEIGPAVKEMGRKAVAQRVRMGRCQGSTVEKAADVSGSKAISPPIEEYRVGRAVCCFELPPAGRQPGINGICRRLADRNLPLLRALAPHGDKATAQVYVAP